MMFLLFVFFLVHTTIISGEECPEEKKVGDTCYTRVAMTDTHKYGCMENCTYRKTLGSDTGLYCFKPGSLHVTECGQTAYPIGVICGSGIRKENCSQCGDTKDNCEGNSSYSDCIFTTNGTCIPRGDEFDFGPYMESLGEALTEFETNTSQNILFPSVDSCSSDQIHNCWYSLSIIECGCGCELAGCWILCLKQRICNLPSYCKADRGSCWPRLLSWIAQVLPIILPPKIAGEIITGLQNGLCT